MSYDVYLMADLDTGAATGPLRITVEEIGNYTFNVGGMWRKALGHSLMELNDRNAGDTLPALDKAVAEMESNPEEYEAMNPPNGWGSYEGALNFLRRLQTGCKEHPKTKIVVHG